MHYMHAHLLGCHILASARTPPVAFNNLGFDWLPFVSGKTCVLVEFASTMGDSGLGIVRASLSPAVLLSGFWGRRIANRLRDVGPR